MRADEERRVGRIREGEGRARGAGVADAASVLPRRTSLGHESASVIVQGAQASPAPPRSHDRVPPPRPPRFPRLGRLVPPGLVDFDDDLAGDTAPAAGELRLPCGRC